MNDKLNELDNLMGKITTDLNSLDKEEAKRIIAEVRDILHRHDAFLLAYLNRVNRVQQRPALAGPGINR